MSVIIPADHHATFAGWAASKPRGEDKAPQWSSRRRIGFIVLSALASWTLVLAPFFLLG